MEMYCKKCGAYIPSGEKKCLACGYEDCISPKVRPKSAILDLTPLLYKSCDLKIGDYILEDAHIICTKWQYSILDGDLGSAPFGAVSATIIGGKRRKFAVEVLEDWN